MRVTKTEHDERLEAAFEKAEGLLVGGSKYMEEILVPFLAFGAKFRVHEDFEIDDALRPFAVEASSDEAAPPAPDVDVLDFPEAPSLDAPAINGYVLQRLEPAPHWTAAQVARFWKIAGDAFFTCYSDSFLNSAIDAYRRAIGTYVESEPRQALLLTARMMRAMVYASYSTDVFDALDEIAPLLAAVKLSADDEYMFCVQAVEAIHPLTESKVPPKLVEMLEPDANLLSLTEPPWLAELALRGLVLSKQVKNPAQTSVLYNAIGNFALRRLKYGESVPEEFFETFGASTNEEVARSAFVAAIEQEKGEFYGEIEEDRKRYNLVVYEVALARLEAHLGRAEAALDAALRAKKAGIGGTLTRQFEATKVLVDILSVFEAERVVFLTKSFEMDCSDVEDLPPYLVEDVVAYTCYLVERMTEWGGARGDRYARGDALAVGSVSNGARRARTRGPSSGCLQNAPRRTPRRALRPRERSWRARLGSPPVP